MSNSFSRRINRDTRAALIAQARAGGCTCTPDITIPPLSPGKVRVVTISHDNDCPHATDNSSATKSLKARINAGELDPR